MEQYATAPAGFMTGGRARNVLTQLARFEAPFLDTAGLTPHMDTTLAADGFLGLAQRDLGGGDPDRTWANAYLWNALLDAALGLLLQ